MNEFASPNILWDQFMTPKTNAELLYILDYSKVAMNYN